MTCRQRCSRQRTVTECFTPVYPAFALSTILRFTHDPILTIIPQKYPPSCEMGSNSVRLDEISILLIFIPSLNKPTYVDVGNDDRCHSSYRTRLFSFAVSFPACLQTFTGRLQVDRVATPSATHTFVSLQSHQPKRSDPIDSTYTIVLCFRVFVFSFG